MRIGNSNPQIIQNDDPKPKKKQKVDPLPSIDLSELAQIDSWKLTAKMSDMVEGLSDDIKHAMYGKVEASPEKGISIGIVKQGRGWEGDRTDFGVQGVYNLKTTVHDVNHLDSMPEAFYSSVGVLGRVGSQEVAAGVEYRFGFESKDLNRLEELLDPNSQQAIGFAVVGTAAVGANYNLGAFGEVAVGPEVNFKFSNTKFSTYIRGEVVGRFGSHSDTFGRVHAGIRLPLNLKH